MFLLKAYITTLLLILDPSSEVWKKADLDNVIIHDYMYIYGKKNRHKIGSL